MAKITAYRKDTGEQVYIPEHWIGHPKLGGPFTTTPPADQSASDSPEGTAATLTDRSATALLGGDAPTTSEVAKTATRKEK